MTATDNCSPNGENVPEEQFEDVGAEVADIGSVGADTAVDVASDFEESNIRVKGQWLDDEPGYVELKVSMLSGEMNISLAPQEAQALAAKLNSAAAFAQGENDE